MAMVHEAGSIASSQPGSDHILIGKNQLQLIAISILDRFGFFKTRQHLLNLARQISMSPPHQNTTKTTAFWGYFFIVTASISFFAFLFTSIISKLLPPSTNPLIASIQNDRYYCFLVPLTLPILVVAVYFHWLSMKIFKHA